MKTGIVYTLFVTALFAVQLLCYMNSTLMGTMNLTGWLFFITACVSHASMFAFALFLVLYLIPSLCGFKRFGGWLMTFGVLLVSVFLYLNMQVYSIYRFHINGFVINMLTGGGASEIFTFDSMLYLKEGLLLLLFALIAIELYLAAMRIAPKVGKRCLWILFSCVIGCTLYSHLYHIYASFVQEPSVIKSRRLLPYYFPTTAYGLMTNLGFEPPVNVLSDSGHAKASSDVRYPLHPLSLDESHGSPNILIIMIDSWNKRSLTQECMPNIYNYALNSEWYDNHFSCSNGTRSGVFGFFFALPSYYWDVFEANQISPIFIDKLLQKGYQCQVYPSATLENPPFFRVVFQKIPHLNTKTQGKTSYDRDRQLTRNFIADLDKLEANKPFFSFLFYDLAHSFQLTEEQNEPFKPAWKFADYSKLNNDTDPTGFFNLYRNTCHHIDNMVGQVFQALQEKGLADNTIVVLTGDHGQEFNENHKNYWGHNGNFSKWQIGIPLIVHTPQTAPRRYLHRTTHYDVIPTLMNQAMGAPAKEIKYYSLGTLLNDSTPRSWHVVGSELNYAFILQGDTILEKMADGSLEVTDGEMNPVNHYHVNPSQFKTAMDKLNSFFQ